MGRLGDVQKPRVPKQGAAQHIRIARKPASPADHRERRALL
jgi:hypothetical protein